MSRPDDAPRHLVLINREHRRDDLVRKAIDVMLSDLAEHWTVTGLARRVGLSRPALARRFVAATGVSPRRYLARARMRRAAELLRQTDWTLAQVGVQVGYDSEFAFNRAFKRFHHVAPGRWRRLGQLSTPMLRAAA
jgi:transcriptional regulator GlxA family with amidase domain